MQDHYRMLHFHATLNELTYLLTQQKKKALYGKTHVKPPTFAERKPQ